MTPTQTKKISVTIIVIVLLGIAFVLFQKTNSQNTFEAVIESPARENTQKTSNPTPTVSSEDSEITTTSTIETSSTETEDTTSFDSSLEFETQTIADELNDILFDDLGL